MAAKDTLRGLLIGLLLGSTGGFFLGHYLAAPSGTGPVAPAPVAAPQAAGTQARLLAEEQAALQDPKNPEVWIALGNDYFDRHEPRQAIEAYDRALALDPKNPGVLTDQGVMYRELKDYAKAIANWEKAQKLDPHHLQSLYNLGVVYAFDLNQPGKARKAWSRLVTLAPDSPQAAQARQSLGQLPPE